MSITPLRALALGISGAVLAIAIIVAIFARKDAHGSANFAGTPLDAPKAAADAILVDQYGKPAHIISPLASATFVFFGYTHCPDECPLALASLGRAYRSLPVRTQAKTRIVFVTVDPAHDSPAILARYAANFDPHIVALTGTHAQLAPVWKAYGVDVEPQGRELVGHGGTIYGVDGTRHVVVIYPPDVKSADLAHDASAIAS